APNPATYVHNPHTWTDPLGLAPGYSEGSQKKGFLSRLFGRKELDIPEPNATVGDLREIAHDNVDDSGNWIYDPMKRGMLQGQEDDQLLRAVFEPDDEARSFMTYSDDGHMMEGNHRMAELIKRASDPRSKIEWDTPIYIRGWGE
ncbi:hypothetical protein, partial [Streptomyces radiopugnans]|uniref:hypothetical protein n=1 Tax=Streptomyces radiopugnans TaxID=403935 RepID=UPI003F1B4FEB